MYGPSIFLPVLLLNAFAYLTIVLRPKIYDVDLFRPMLWNFKLSLLPLLILVGNVILFIVLGSIAGMSEFAFLRYVPLAIFVVGCLVWILLLPNSGYVITELNLTHRNMDKNEVPIWYDIVSVMSFALSGIVNTLANIVGVQYIYLILLDPVAISKNDQIVFIVSALVLNLLVSIGVYLGRSIRFNSWDVIHIKTFLAKLKTHFKQKGAMKDFILFVTFHTLFFMVMYLSFGIQNYFAGLPTI